MSGTTSCRWLPESTRYCATHGHYERFSYACVYCGRVGCARCPAHWVKARAVLCLRARRNLNRRPQTHPTEAP